MKHKCENCGESDQFALHSKVAVFERKIDVSERDGKLVANVEGTDPKINWDVQEYEYLECRNCQHTIPASDPRFEIEW